MNSSHRFRSIFLASALGIILGGSVLVFAAQSGAGAQKDANKPIGKITPWEAIRIATTKVPGRALNANFEYAEGHWVYGVMVVTNTTPKKIQEVEIDPITGKIGDTEEITPDGEAKEMAAELNAALGNKPAKATTTGGKAEKPEKE
jgi:hypothetical protein